MDCSLADIDGWLVFTSQRYEEKTLSWSWSHLWECVGAWARVRWPRGRHRLSCAFVSTCTAVSNFAKIFTHECAREPTQCKPDATELPLPPLMAKVQLWPFEYFLAYFLGYASIFLSNRKLPSSALCLCDWSLKVERAQPGMERAQPGMESPLCVCLHAGVHALTSSEIIPHLSVKIETFGTSVCESK